MSRYPPGVPTDVWEPTGSPVGLAVILPGRGYPPAAPGCAYAGYVLRAAGWRDIEVPEELMAHPETARKQLTETLKQRAHKLAKIKEEAEKMAGGLGDKNDNLVLRAARLHGVSQVFAVARPDSTLPPHVIDEFPAVHSVSDLLPVESGRG